jgi:hypothetical protein
MLELQTPSEVEYLTQFFGAYSVCDFLTRERVFTLTVNLYVHFNVLQFRIFKITIFADSQTLTTPFTPTSADRKLASPEEPMAHFVFLCTRVEN